MKDIKKLVRPNVLALMSRELKKVAPPRPKVRLDKAEMPFNAPLNRYAAPDAEADLKTLFARPRQVAPENVCFAMGQHPLELLLRTFCIPQKDNVVIQEPALPAFKSLAMLHNTEVRTLRPSADFGIDIPALLSLCNAHTKIILLSNPNYPTGHFTANEKLLDLAEAFDGLIVVDDTYAAFSRTPSLSAKTNIANNIVVIGTFAAQYAAAGLNLGYAVSHPEVCTYLEAVKCGAVLPKPVLDEAEHLCGNRRFDADKWVSWIIEERGKVLQAVSQLPLCLKLYPTAANYFMMQVRDAAALRDYLAAQGIAVTDCSDYADCENCLCITIGTKDENSALLGALRRY